MDHVYISFSAFLWTSTFVRLNTIFLMLKGTIGLWIRRTLQKWKIINMKPFNAEELVAQLLLESKNIFLLKSNFLARSEISISLKVLWQSITLQNLKTEFDFVSQTFRSSPTMEDLKSKICWSLTST